MTLPLIQKYHWILFDADETLFHFDAFSGLKRMFAPYGIEFTEQHYHDYQAINKALWIEYQNHTVTAQELQNRRFMTWADKLSLNATDLNRTFLDIMAKISTPIDGAIGLLDSLRGKTNVGIITNSFADFVYKRFEHTPLAHHFEILVISEEVGVAKPHPDIFEHALELMGNPERSRVLMVGDTPHSDILGARDAGFDTCWLNMDNKPIPDGIIPTYEVSSLRQLESLLTAK